MNRLDDVGLELPSDRTALTKTRPIRLDSLLDLSNQPHYAVHVDHRTFPEPLQDLVLGNLAG